MTEHKTMNTVIHAAFRRDLARFGDALGSFPAGSRPGPTSSKVLGTTSPISSAIITKMKKPSSGPNSANLAPPNRSWANLRVNMPKC